MPVSKKRKKEGKPVQRKESVAPATEHPHGPDAKPAVPVTRAGRPSNPFVAQQQSRRGAQRGR
ncbi:MAG TPA: hypothetical protein VD838_03745 [Anaeromyxobacteraceae bacterium]|nr:hypothetical protein [Anaeromyxobacteraceae bacterium]